MRGVKEDMLDAVVVDRRYDLVGKMWVKEAVVLFVTAFKVFRRSCTTLFI